MSFAWHVDFAAATSAGAAANLEDAASNALAAACALNGSVAARTAAQFTSTAAPTSSIDQGDGRLLHRHLDLLIDITGATGTISAASFLG